jgi:hypothetical protein
LSSGRFVLDLHCRSVFSFTVAKVHIHLGINIAGDAVQAGTNEVGHDEGFGGVRVVSDGDAGWFGAETSL